MLKTIAVLMVVASGSPNDTWPGFRGTGNSRTDAQNLPLTWSATENIAWSVPLTGYGQSSPVVWNDRAFVTTVDGRMKETLIVSAINLKDGSTVWQKKFPASMKIPVSGYVSQGAPTPVVDETAVYAFFESGDLVAVKHDGTEFWKRSFVEDYGRLLGNHGLGSSIAQTKDAIIALVDHAGPSYLIALNKQDGKNKWKVDRPARVSWSSPIVSGENHDEILISSSGIVESLSSTDGKRLWWLEGVDGNTVASPSVTADLVVVGSSKSGANVAVKRDGNGKLDASQLAWRATSATSSFGSPLIHRGHVYFVNRAGGVYCLELKTGESKWTTRLWTSCWASPIGAGDRVYFFAKDGTTTVVASGSELKKLAQNELPTSDKVYGVAVIDGAFLVRTSRRLVLIRNRG